MNHLMRELAPVSEDAWARVDDEATRSIKYFIVEVGLSFRINTPGAAVHLAYQ